MNVDLSRRLATSTPPWSSTSPSTSSCRWCSARRWCTPTTSSSSRCPTHKAFRWWFPKNAFDGTFQDGYFDGYDPYTNPSAASGFTSAAFRWKKSVFYFVLKRRGFGRQLNWPASQSVAFCGREILLTLQKSASTWPWRRANSFFAKKYFNPCYRFGHSLLPSTIERWSKTHRWDTRSVIRQQLLHK